MPSSFDILAGLSRIANEAVGFAMAWHLAVLALIAALIAGWRPGGRVSAALITAPVASACAFAWAYGNPFNGSVLAVVAVALLALGLRTSSAQWQSGPTWARLLGAALVGFAFVYPHFLEGRSPLAYLYGAPMGLIPCPSLSLAVGLSLLGNIPGGRGQARVLAGAATFYALFGTLRLGVWLDLGLLVGAAGLALLAKQEDRGGSV